MQQLNWQPSDSGERAEANGFTYLADNEPMDERCFSSLHISWNHEGAEESINQDFMVATRDQIKSYAQTHANAAALTSKASTIDVEACAKEVVSTARCAGYTYQGQLESVKEIIANHLKPACVEVEKCVAQLEREGFLCAELEDTHYVKDIIRKHLQPASESAWISVEERLPETAGYYLVSTKRGNSNGSHQSVECSDFSTFKNKWGIDCKFSHGSVTVTHWQPLPQPPAKESK